MQYVISQADIEERNYQVSLMKDIYSSASHTVVYLGTVPEGGSMASQIAEHAWDFSRTVDATKTLPSDKTSPDDLSSSSEKNYVDEIISRPWFRRVWTFQELVLSQRVWVQIGQYRIDWDVLCYLASAARGVDSTFIASMQAARERFISALYNPENYRILYPTLHETLSHRRELGVSDLRDLVYGHLSICGIASKDVSKDMIFEVDYQKSVAEVFADARKLMLISNPQLDLLEDIGFELEMTGFHIEGLPSWVPNWSSTSTESRQDPWKSICPPMAWIDVGQASKVLDYDQVMYCQTSGPELGENPFTILYKGDYLMIGFVTAIFEIRSSPSEVDDKAIVENIALLDVLLKSCSNLPTSDYDKHELLWPIDLELEIFNRLIDIWKARLGKVFLKFPFEGKATVKSLKREQEIGWKCGVLFQLFKMKEHSAYDLRGATLDMKLMLYLLRYKSCKIIDNQNLVLLTGDKIALVPTTCQIYDRVIGIPRNTNLSKYYNSTEHPVTGAYHLPVTFSPVIVRPKIQNRTSVEFSYTTYTQDGRCWSCSIIGYAWIQRTTSWDNAKDVWVFDAWEDSKKKLRPDFESLELSLHSNRANYKYGIIKQPKVDVATRQKARFSEFNLMSDFRSITIEIG